MAVLRALVFAVFSGFIGAAPAAPVTAGGADHGGYADARSQTQKRERGAYEIVTPGTPCVAAAPPCTDGPPVAAGLPPSPLRTFAAMAAPVLARPGRPAPPPGERIRAGLLDLPPPTR